jgi:hypothetical protein
MAVAPQSGDIVLKDGTRLTADGKIIRPKKTDIPASRMIAIPSNTEAQRIVTQTRRTLADIPAPPKSCNAISVVISYSMFGMSDEEIAIATGMTVEQIGRIKMLEAYTVMQDAIVEGILNADAEDVRTFIRSAQKAAAVTVAASMQSEDEVLRFKAAQDLLDRGGNSKELIVNNKHSLEGGLTIEVVDKRNQNAPHVDVKLEDA